MAWETRPAVRDKTSALVAIAGASGSGKTYTAILLAFGLAYPGMSNDEIMATIEREGRSRITFVDTEGGRGLHYAPGAGQRPNFVSTFPFEYGELRAPYTPEVYQEAIVESDKAGAHVIIVDSMSHEYESEGGIMEIADQIESGILKPGITEPPAPDDRNGWKAWATKPVKSPGNWKEPKTRHKKMVNRAIQSRAHVIFCLRAEEKMLLRRVPKMKNGEQEVWNGKPQFVTEVVPAEDRPLLERWQPICEKRFMYEMTVSFLLTPVAPGVGHPIKNLQAELQAIFHEGERLGRKHGEGLASWSRGQISAPASGGTAPTGDRPAQQKPAQTARAWVDGYIDRITQCQTLEALADEQKKGANAITKLRNTEPDLHQEVVDANAKRYAELQPAADDDDQFPETPSGGGGQFGGDAS